MNQNEVPNSFAQGTVVQPQTKKVKQIEML